MRLCTNKIPSLLKYGFLIMKEFSVFFCALCHRSSAGRATDL